MIFFKEVVMKVKAKADEDSEGEEPLENGYRDQMSVGVRLQS